jgi:hypothetical protein
MSSSLFLFSQLTSLLSHTFLSFFTQRFFSSFLTIVLKKYTEDLCDSVHNLTSSRFFFFFQMNEPHTTRSEAFEAAKKQAAKKAIKENRDEKKAVDLVGVCDDCPLCLMCNHHCPIGFHLPGLHLSIFLPLLCPLSL